MNRRGFFATFAKATAGAMATLAIDPEQLLWVPGKKTIIDLGARPVVPATDAELIASTKTILLASVAESRTLSLGSAQAIKQTLHTQGSLIGGMKLEILGSDGELHAFRYNQNDQLVGTYSAQDMELLAKPMFPRQKPTRYGR